MRDVKLNQTPLRIFFDLSGHDKWFTANLKSMVEVMHNTCSSDAVLVEAREGADCVLRVGGGSQLNDSWSERFKWSEKKSPPEFVWDMADLPTGNLPGFYASLPAYMFNRNRHRSFCLPIICNELVQPYEFEDARYLFGFFGAVSSGLRARIVSQLQASHNKKEALIEARDSIWGEMFNRKKSEPKLAYVENLRQCRFNLCPRGCVLAGTGSRLYETMQAARVPVIISDHMVLPEGVDWDSCSVRIRERDIADIPHILASYSDRWQQMAENARRSYEEHFAHEAILGELGRQLCDLLNESSRETRLTILTGRARIALGLLMFLPRQYYGKLQRLTKNQHSKSN